jgi:uncharacterized iron-regulated membrane protein
MAFNPRVWFRKSHRLGAVIVALPFLVVLVTGILLQVKKEFAWIQPPAKRGIGKEPTIPFAAILEAVRAIPEAKVNEWADIERLDVRPDRGMVKVLCRNRYEVQVDTNTGSVLQVAYRRSDLIESIHDGSFFHDQAKLWVFLPTAIIVLGLWVTGMYLFVLPLAVRRRQSSRTAQLRPRDQTNSNQPRDRTNNGQLHEATSGDHPDSTVGATR